MKRVALALLVGTMLGYLGGCMSGDPAPAGTPETETQQQAAAVPELPPRIPPTESPPLYPDPPNEPMHWSRDTLQQVYDARIAAVRSVASGNVAASPSPAFQRQSFRTHSIGASFRTKRDVPQLSNRAGVLSLVDDADQHEGVTDFYVYVGGNGRIVTDGVIENRVYGSNPRSAASSGAKITSIFGGELNGQPIRDGNTYNVRAGDWLAIPPSVPHWPGFDPGEGLMYVMVKINIGLYPPNLMY